MPKAARHASGTQRPCEATDDNESLVAYGSGALPDVFTAATQEAYARAFDERRVMSFETYASSVTEGRPLEQQGLLRIPCIIEAGHASRRTFSGTVVADFNASNDSCLSLTDGRGGSVIVRLRGAYAHALQKNIHLLRDLDYVTEVRFHHGNRGAAWLCLTFFGWSLFEYASLNPADYSPPPHTWVNFTRQAPSDLSRHVIDPGAAARLLQDTFTRLEAVKAALGAVLAAAVVPEEVDFNDEYYNFYQLGRRYALDDHMSDFCEQERFGFDDKALRRIEQQARAGGLRELQQEGQRLALMDHQLTTILRMQQLEVDTMYRGGVLAEEMGLGKTISMLGHLCARRAQAEEQTAGAGSKRKASRKEQSSVECLRPNDMSRLDQMEASGLMKFRTQELHGWETGQQVLYYAPRTTLYITTHRLADQVVAEARRWTTLRPFRVDTDFMRDACTAAEREAKIRSLGEYDLVVMTFEELQQALDGHGPSDLDIKGVRKGDSIRIIYNEQLVWGTVVSVVPNEVELHMRRRASAREGYVALHDTMAHWAALHRHEVNTAFHVRVEVGEQNKCVRVTCDQVLAIRHQERGPDKTLDFIKTLRFERCVIDEFQDAHDGFKMGGARL
jgi:hypothetical protein